LALAICEEELGCLDVEKVKKALKYLDWPGRLEILSAKPLMILDACINRESCTNVLEALTQLEEHRVTTIIGIPSDKDYLGVAQAMFKVSEHIILTKSQNPHYKFGTEQVKALEDIGIKALWSEGIGEALEKARSLSDNPICILGTTSLISDVKVLAATPMLL
jgi:dihydrofolate synthase/folylpolyglutamate synthase